ncbi:hypothetical protein Bpfe_021443 [Biomphalaria pfeifferi]|uniref:Uncharacterized protein n=1 Tax=Biomphalaria pfeifferi TaxID=112525 RepID=A0AAD8B865_BIOPF|nr:hypothetical protein Bpfe_021443 [Biomphalaria pfeifferi]
MSLQFLQFLLVIVLLVCVNNSVVQCATPEPEMTCSDAVHMCKNDFANSDKKRHDVLLLIQCLKAASCDDNDDDTAMRDKEVYIARTNVLHYSPLDDMENGAKSAPVVSAVTLILSSMAALVMIQRRQ